MNFQPSEESVREKMKRSGALFASDEVQVVLDRLDAYVDALEYERSLNDSVVKPMRAALERIAERVDVDSNGEYIVLDQPALSAVGANRAAREALALGDDEDALRTVRVSVDGVPVIGGTIERRLGGWCDQHGGYTGERCGGFQYDGVACTARDANSQERS